MKARRNGRSAAQKTGSTKAPTNHNTAKTSEHGAIHAQIKKTYSRNQKY